MDANKKREETSFLEEELSNLSKRMLQLENSLAERKSKSSSSQLKSRGEAQEGNLTSTYNKSINAQAILVLEFVTVLTAIATVVFLYIQNGQLVESNRSIGQQTELFRKQNLQQVVSTNSQMASDLIRDLYEAKLADPKVGLYDVWEVPQPLVHRIATVSEALAPYDTVKYEMVLSDTIITGKTFASRERGQLLGALASLFVKFPLQPNPNFEYSFLANQDILLAQFRKGNLAHSCFANATIRYSNFQNSDLTNCNFDYANLYTSKYYDSDFTGSSMVRARFFKLDTSRIVPVTDLTSNERDMQWERRVKKIRDQIALEQNLTVIDEMYRDRNIASFHNAVFDSVDVIKPINFDRRIIRSFKSSVGANFIW
ncbi:pentapeptide repeat protein [Neolewinella xylanilytica]|uniref:Pentapeptide repeat protein n=1 Tax=Neolewinella xylanilytica TaxID=1514080 RepID=A0A2S6I141_9BACT|nr:pentapeptide repeat-containing protein [Neolewinella xylanilytica]PPK84689.1 pentapeptide repeat protein [Neolewinella xylanilytica]